MTERHKQLAEDIRNYIFQTFDAEEDLSGDDAGLIAAYAERAVIQAITSLVD